MQSVAIINQRWVNEHAEASQALNNAAQRLVQRLFGCWHHDLGRPFTVNGKSYRVCTKCGMARDFNLATWKTYGASYRMRPNSGLSYPLQPSSVSSNLTTLRLVETTRPN